MIGLPSDPTADAWSIPLPDWAAGTTLAVFLGAWLLFVALFASPADYRSSNLVSSANSAVVPH